MTKKIEFIDLKAQYKHLKNKVDERISQVLEHGQFIMGPEVRELEKKLEDYTAAKHCITVSSGTEALLISLMAIGVQPGDEVITTAFTFVATAEVIALLGAVPVFVDVEPDTCNINVSKIESAISSRTRAIIPVSLYGQVADMDEINEIASRHGIVVIEDAAQSFGALYRGKRSCNVSSIACTSFFPSKPLGCYGDGGAIFTDNSDLAQAMREIRVHGQERRYYHTRIGVGGRMDTLQCAIVLAKLDNLDWEIEQRLNIGARYVSALGNLEGIRTLGLREDRTCVWGQFTLLCEDRDLVLAKLNSKGVPTAIHYPIPLHLQPAYAKSCRVVGDLKYSERVANQVLSLPMHPYLDSVEQDFIISSLTDQDR